MLYCGCNNLQQNTLLIDLKLRAVTTVAAYVLIDTPGGTLSPPSLFDTHTTCPSIDLSVHLTQDDLCYLNKVSLPQASGVLSPVVGFVCSGPTEKGDAFLHCSFCLVSVHK